MKKSSVVEIGISPVKALRLAFGETQQQFAHRLGIAIRTAARWETVRPPGAKDLAKLADLANSIGKTELEKVFLDDLDSSIGRRSMRQLPRSGQERVWVSALVELMNNPEFASDREAVFKILRKVATRLFVDHYSDSSTESLEEHKVILLKEIRIIHAGIPLNDEQANAILEAMLSAAAPKPKEEGEK